MHQFLHDYQLLSCRLPNISAIRLQDIPDKDLQETPFVGVNNLTDYLRCGNVKVNAQLLRLDLCTQPLIDDSKILSFRYCKK
jgi:hypothetical protein